jgi:hypothetical protein
MKIFSDMLSPAELKKNSLDLEGSLPLNVNAHFHTPYSFSSFSDIREIFELAESDNVDILGINDFITTAGYDEFGMLAMKYRRFPLFNIEFMGLLTDAQQKGIRINDPNNPGRIYFCGKGLVLHDQISVKHRGNLDKVFSESLRQMKEMILRLNRHLSGMGAPFLLDFDDIQRIYTKGLVRERHVVKALRIELKKYFPDEVNLSKFLALLYIGKDPSAPFTDTTAWDNELRGRLLKKGGPAFVEENQEAFLSIETIKEIIIEAGGIPCYPVLLDDEKGNFTEFEKNYDSLYQTLTGLNVFCLELIPGRNDITHLTEFVRFFNEQNFVITLGTEHNTPEKIPLNITCRGGVPLTGELKQISYNGACIIAAHQYLVSRGEPGYLEKNRKPDLEKNKEFVRFGNAVIHNFINR